MDQPSLLGTSFLEGKGQVWEEVKDKAPKAYFVSSICCRISLHSMTQQQDSPDVKTTKKLNFMHEKIPLQGGFAYWPLAQLINFKFMPVFMRSAYVAAAAFIWTNFLCYLKSRRLTTEASAGNVCRNSL